MVQTITIDEQHVEVIDSLLEAQAVEAEFLARYRRSKVDKETFARRAKELRGALTAFRLGTDSE